MSRQAPAIRERAKMLSNCRENEMITRRSILKGSAALGALAASAAICSAGPRHGPPRRCCMSPRRAPSCRCCAGSASSRPRKTPSSSSSKPSPRRPACRSACSAKASTTCSPRPRSPPMSASGPDMFWGLYSLPASVPDRNAWTSPTSPTISARNMAAGRTAAEIYGKGRRQVDLHPRRLQRQRHQLPQIGDQGRRLRQGSLRTRPASSSSARG